MQKENIANRQLEKSQGTQVNRKNTDLFFRKSLSFGISKKEKMDAVKALWISRTIYDWVFFIKLTQFEKAGSKKKKISISLEGVDYGTDNIWILNSFS